MYILSSSNGLLPPPLPTTLCAQPAALIFQPQNTAPCLVAPWSFRFLLGNGAACPDPPSFSIPPGAWILVSCWWCRQSPLSKGSGCFVGFVGSHSRGSPLASSPQALPASSEPAPCQCCLSTCLIVMEGGIDGLAEVTACSIPKNGWILWREGRLSCHPYKKAELGFWQEVCPVNCPTQLIAASPIPPTPGTVPALSLSTRKQCPPCLCRLWTGTWDHPIQCLSAFFGPHPPQCLLNSSPYPPILSCCHSGMHVLNYLIGKVPQLHHQPCLLMPVLKSDGF